MYVAVGTTSDALRGFVVLGDAVGGWTSCLPVRDVTEEYVEREDWARLWDRTLEDRGGASTGDSGAWSAGAFGAAPLSESRRLLGGKGLAPLGRATRLLRRSDRYEAI